ncbi:hypothetical protein CKO25_14745 [Thiocapsa imhoffii]|uniref:Uncharacterized protein n=1 Tax=Thiocapsa imhoffii TaxID=382777 RepID=A0A9X0WJG0_9GAMM|nr:hypothetical protein [Thiocapsa imhoffii]MBK1645882.1 hypothetical protein [Thiocapsa imhoffii]
MATRPDLDCPVRTLYIASTLHHLEVLSDAQKAGIVASALGEALQRAMRHRMRTLASASMGVSRTSNSSRVSAAGQEALYGQSNTRQSSRKLLKVGGHL